MPSAAPTARPSSVPSAAPNATQVADATTAGLAEAAALADDAWLPEAAALADDSGGLVLTHGRTRRSKSYNWILRMGLVVLFFVLLFLEPAITFASPLVAGRARTPLVGSRSRRVAARTRIAPTRRVASTPRRRAHPDRPDAASPQPRRPDAASPQPRWPDAASPSRRNPAQVGGNERRILLGMSILNDLLLFCFLWELLATHLGLFLFAATIVLATWIVAARADLVASSRRRRGFRRRTRR